MLWVVILFVLISLWLMIKGGGWYFTDNTSAEYAPIKRKGFYFIAVGAAIMLSLAFWNEFVYKRSQSALEREEKRIAAICTDVVKAFNKTKEPIEQTMTDMKLVQFPFLPKASSKAIGQCEFQIQATVEASLRTGSTSSKTYEAHVRFDRTNESWHVLDLKWLD